MISDYFPPEVGSASFLFYELAKDLTKKGDRVKVLTGFPRYHINNKETDTGYKGNFLLTEKIDGIDIFRIRTFNLPRRINILRGLDQFLTAFLYFVRALFLKGYDCILIYSPPLPLGLTSYFLKVIRGKKTILNVQDLFPKSAIDLGVLKNKYLIKFFNSLERFTYLKNDYIAVHSRGNMEHVSRMTEGRARTVVIPNWVNTDEIYPGPKENEFSRKYNLADKFIVSFAGILGESQDLDIVLDAAKSLNSHKDIIFIIVGDGRKKKEIEKRKRDENIDNLLLIPIQPKEKYPFILHSSDIGLVTLIKEVKSPVVPSKILNIMASGIPVVASLSLEGDASRIIRESESGFCVKPGDLDNFIKAIVKIYESDSLKRRLGENGRRFVENNCSLEICSAKFEKILGSV